MVKVTDFPNKIPKVVWQCVKGEGYLGKVFFREWYSSWTLNDMQVGLPKGLTCCSPIIGRLMEFTWKMILFPIPFLGQKKTPLNLIDLLYFSKAQASKPTWLALNLTYGLSGPSLCARTCPDLPAMAHSLTVTLSSPFSLLWPCLAHESDIYSWQPGYKLGSSE